MRHAICLCFALSILSAGCGDDDAAPPPPPPTDTGMSDGGTGDGGGMDGGTDGGGTDGGGTDGGTDGGGTDGGGMDGGGGTDGGGTDGGGGSDTLPDPPDGGTTVAIDFSDDCPVFASCDSDIVGTWTYTGACVPLAVSVPAMFDACADPETGEPIYEVRSRSGSVSGFVMATDTTITRTISTEIQLEIFIPSLCTMDAECTFIEMMSGYSCPTVAGGCLCTVETTSEVNETEAYTVAGSTVMMMSGDTYEVCVDGDSLTYVNSTVPDDPADFDNTIYRMGR